MSQPTKPNLSRLNTQGMQWNRAREEKFHKEANSKSLGWRLAALITAIAMPAGYLTLLIGSDGSQPELIRFSLPIFAAAAFFAAYAVKGDALLHRLSKKGRTDSASTQFHHKS